MGAIKKPFFTGRVILSQGGGNVNNFFSENLRFLRVFLVLVHKSWDALHKLGQEGCL